MNNCLYAKNIKVKDLRDFIKKNELDIKGRSRAELCEGLKRMYNTKPKKVRNVSGKQARRVRKSCMGVSMKETRATIAKYHYPVKAASKKNLCRGLYQYVKTRPRHHVSRAHSMCKYFQKSRTSRILSRVKINKKPLSKIITARTKNELCKKINKLGY